MLLVDYCTYEYSCVLTAISLSIGLLYTCHVHRCWGQPNPDMHAGMSHANATLLVHLMEAIPLCDIIEVYINIYLRLYTTIFHNSE